MVTRIYIYFIIPVALFYIVTFSILSFQSRKLPEDIGLRDGILRACPGIPNCVLSEIPGKPEYIEPIVFKGEPSAAWALIKQALLTLNGNIEKEDGQYLWATFHSRFWRFTDDMELRLDQKNSVIQVRSASRVGKGDMGVNRKRVEKLRALFNVMVRLK